MANNIFALFNRKCSDGTSKNITLVCENQDLKWNSISNCSNLSSKIRCSDYEYQVSSVLKIILIKIKMAVKSK